MGGLAGYERLNRGWKRNVRKYVTFQGNYFAEYLKSLLCGYYHQVILEGKLPK